MPFYTIVYVLSFGPHKIKLFQHFNTLKKMSDQAGITIRDEFVRKLFIPQPLVPFIVIHEKLSYYAVPLVRKRETVSGQLFYDYHLFMYDHQKQYHQFTQFAYQAEDKGNTPNCISTETENANTNTDTPINSSPDEFDEITLSSSLCKVIDTKLVGKSLNFSEAFESSNTALHLIEKLQQLNENCRKKFSEEISTSKELFLHNVLMAQVSLAASSEVEVEIPEQSSVNDRYAFLEISTYEDVIPSISQSHEIISELCVDKNSSNSLQTISNNISDISNNRIISSYCQIDGTSDINNGDSQETQCDTSQSYLEQNITIANLILNDTGFLNKSDSETSSVLQICDSPPYYDTIESPEPKVSVSDEDYRSPPSSPSLNYLSQETNNQYQELYEASDAVFK